MKNSSDITSDSTRSQNDRPGSSASHRQSADHQSTQDVHSPSSENTSTAPIVWDLYGYRSSDQPHPHSRLAEGNSTDPSTLRSVRSSDRLRPRSGSTDGNQTAPSTLHQVRSSSELHTLSRTSAGDQINTPSRLLHFDRTVTTDNARPAQEQSLPQTNPLVEDFHGSQEARDDQTSAPTPLRRQLLNRPSSLTVRRPSEGASTPPTTQDRSSLQLSGSLERTLERTTEGTRIPSTSYVVQDIYGFQPSGHTVPRSQPTETDLNKPPVEGISTSNTQTVVEALSTQPNIISNPRNTNLWTPTPSDLTVPRTLWIPERHSNSNVHPYSTEPSISRNRNSLDITEISEENVPDQARNYRRNVSNRPERSASHSTDDRNAAAELKMLGINDDVVQIIVDAVNNREGTAWLYQSLSTRNAELAERHSTYVDTLLDSLGIRDDHALGSDGLNNYFEARKHAQTFVRVIWNDGNDTELNDAKKELLKLAPKRLWLRSLVNPKKDVVDWYEASWKNQHEKEKLDTRTMLGKVRYGSYWLNQFLAGPTNSRVGNLSFIGGQAAAGTAYTWYIEGKFPTSTLLSTLEYAATARFFYSLLPNPMNQAIDTIQFQGVSIGLYKFQEKFLTKKSKTE